MVASDVEDTVSSLNKVDLLAQKRQEKLERLGQQNQFANLNQSYTTLPDGTIESNANKIWNEHTPAELQFLSGYAMGEYYTPEEDMNSAEGRRLYQYLTKDGNTKPGLSTGGASTSDVRYDNTIDPKYSQPWRRSGETGPDLNAKQFDVPMQFNAATVLEGLLHGNKRLLDQRKYTDVLSKDALEHDGGVSEYYKGGMDEFWGDATNEPELTPERMEQLKAEFDSYLVTPSDQYSNQRGLTEHEKAIHAMLATDTDPNPLVHAAKSFGKAFYDEAVSKPAAFIDDVLGIRDETEQEREERVTSMFGYDSRYAQDQAAERQELNEVFDREDATPREMLKAGIGVIANAVTDPGLIGSSFGTLAAWVLPGSAAAKLTKGASKLAQIDRLIDAGKLTKAQGAAQKAKLLTTTKAGVITALASQTGQISAAFGNLNQQYEEWVDNNNGVTPDGGKAQWVMSKLPMQLLNQNLDKITDMSILKSPTVLKGLKDTVSGATNKQMMKFLGGVGKAVGSTAFIQMPKEAAQEYTQQMMEAFNTRYGTAKFENADTFIEFLKDPRNYSEGRLSALEGAGGAGQFAAASTGVSTFNKGLKGAKSVKDKYDQHQKEVLQKDSYTTIEETQNDYQKAMEDGDLTVAGAKYKELVALEKSVERSEEAQRERNAELNSIKIDLYKRAKEAIAEKTETLGASKEDKDAIEGEFELDKQERKTVAKQVETLLTAAGTVEERQEAVSLIEDLVEKGGLREYEVDAIVEKVTGRLDEDTDVARIAELEDVIAETTSDKNKQKFEAELAEQKKKLNADFAKFKKVYNPFQSNTEIEKFVDLTDDKVKELVDEFLGGSTRKKDLKNKKAIQLAAKLQYAIDQGKITDESTVNVDGKTTASAKEVAEVAIATARNMIGNDKITSTKAMNQAIQSLVDAGNASDVLSTLSKLIDKNVKVAKVERARGKYRSKDASGEAASDLVELEDTTYGEQREVKRTAEGARIASEKRIKGKLKGFTTAKYDKKKAASDNSRIGKQIKQLAGKNKAAANAMRERLNKIYKAVNNEEYIDLKGLFDGIYGSDKVSKAIIKSVIGNITKEVEAYNKNKKTFEDSLKTIEEKGLDRRNTKQKVKDTLEKKTTKIEKEIETIDEKIETIEKSDTLSADKELKKKRYEKNKAYKLEEIASVKKVLKMMTKDIAKAKEIYETYSGKVKDAQERLYKVNERIKGIVAKLHANTRLDENGKLKVIDSKLHKVLVEQDRRASTEAYTLERLIALDGGMDTAHILLSDSLHNNPELREKDMNLIEQAYLALREEIFSTTTGETQIEKKLVDKTTAMLNGGRNKAKEVVDKKVKNKELAKKRREAKASDLAQSIIDMQELITVGGEVVTELQDRRTVLKTERETANEERQDEIDLEIAELETKIADTKDKVSIIKDQYLTKKTSLETSIGKNWEGGSVLSEFQLEVMKAGTDHADRTPAYKESLDEKKTRETNPSKFLEFTKKASMIMSLNLELEEFKGLKDHAIALNAQLVNELTPRNEGKKGRKDTFGSIIPASIAKNENYASPYDDRAFYALLDTREDTDGNPIIHMNLNAMLVLDKTLYEFISTDAGNLIVNDYETVSKMLNGKQPQTSAGKAAVKKNFKDGNFLRLVVESLGKQVATDLGIRPTETSDGTGKEPDTEFYMSLGHKVILLGQAKGVFKRNKTDGKVKADSEKAKKDKVRNVDTTTATVSVEDAQTMYDNPNAKSILMVKVKGKGVKGRATTLDKYLLSEHGVVAGAISEVFEDVRRKKAPSLTPIDNPVSNLKVNKAEVIKNVDERASGNKKKYIEKQGKKPWVFNTKVYEELKAELDNDPIDRDNFHEVGPKWKALGFLEIPVNETEITAFEKDRRIAKNAGLLREIQHLDNWYNRHIVKGRGETLYFKYRMDRENRLRQDSNTLNTEQSLIHRFIITPKNNNTIQRDEFVKYVVPEDASKADVRIEGAAIGVLQGLGIDIENRDLQKKELVDIGIAVMKMGKTEMDKLVNKISTELEGEVEISGKKVKFDATEHHTQFLTTKEMLGRYADGKPAKFELIAEYDAKTNAFGYKALQVVKTDANGDIDIEGNLDLANKVYIDFKVDDQYKSGDENIVDFNNRNKTLDMYVNAGVQATKAEKEEILGTLEENVSKKSYKFYEEFVTHSFNDFADYEKEFDTIYKEARQSFKDIILPVQYASTLQSAIDGFATGISAKVPQDLLDMANEILANHENADNLPAVMKALKAKGGYKYIGLMGFLLQEGTKSKKSTKQVATNIAAKLTDDKATTWDDISFGDLTGTSNPIKMDKVLRDIVIASYKQSIGTAFFKDVGHIIDSNRLLTNTSKAITHAFIYKLDKAIDEAEASGKKLNKAQKTKIAQWLVTKELFPKLKTEMGDTLEAIDTEKTEGTDTIQTTVSERMTGKKSETLGVTKKEYAASTASAAVLTTLASDAQTQAMFAERIGKDNFLNMFDAVAGDITKLGSWAGKSNQTFAEVALRSDPFYSMLTVFNGMMGNLTPSEVQAINAAMRSKGATDQKYVPLIREFNEGIDDLGIVRMLNDVQKVDEETASDAVMGLEDVHKEIYEFTLENARNRQELMGNGIKVNHFDFGRQSQVEVDGDTAIKYLEGIYGKDFENVVKHSPDSLKHLDESLGIDSQLADEINNMFKEASEVTLQKDIKTLVDSTMEQIPNLGIAVSEKGMRKAVERLAEGIIRYDNRTESKLLAYVKEEISFNTGTGNNTFNNTTVGKVIDVMLNGKNMTNQAEQTRSKINQCS
jgi:hypothetical protein